MVEPPKTYLIPTYIWVRRSVDQTGSYFEMALNVSSTLATYLICPKDI